MSTQSSANVTAQEEIQRLRTRIAELERENQIVNELRRPEERTKYCSTAD
jgi:hypothetical protein